MNTENTQVKKDDSELSKQNVNKSRRSFARAGMAAPVIMTLASKPVFAFQGLSNMLSTTGSATCRGDNRYGGMSPGFWKEFQGSTLLGDSGKIAWSLTGQNYGTPKPAAQCPQGHFDENKWDNYVVKSGTLFSQVFGTGYTHADESLREVLNKYENDVWDGIKPFHLIAGYLNARYFDAKAGSGTTQYIFTEIEFWQMFNDITPYRKSLLVSLLSNNYYDQGPHNCTP